MIYCDNNKCVHNIEYVLNLNSCKLKNIYLYTNFNWNDNDMRCENFE